MKHVNPISVEYRHLQPAPAQTFIRDLVDAFILFLNFIFIIKAL